MTKTTTITETAYAKINLALHVRARRADGYHDIETLFAFAEDGDGLTAEPAADLSLRITGPFGAGLDAGEANLVLRAARALQKATKTGQGAALTLDKRLPVAAGIGGGSADAAAALRALSHLWRLDVTPDQAMAIGAQLGADVPACIAAVTVRGEGTGTELAAVAGDAIAGMPLLLVNPGVACPTGPVFAGWDGVDRGPLPAGDARSVALAGRNDLQPAADALVPEIAGVLARLRAMPGVLVARMSGSGATCFALFDSIAARDAAVPGLADCWVLASRLR